MNLVQAISAMGLIALPPIHAANPVNLAASDEIRRRPNIVLILADDLGYSDLGCYGGEIATPNLDSLAASGLKFTQFYNTARCWPTRAALMTGYYAQQVRRDSLPGVAVAGGNRGVRPDWAVLVPELLKPAGYRSYHSGKWHIDGMPIENGFDQSYHLKDQGRFFNPKLHWKNDVKLPPVPKGTDFYATTALADQVIDVLQQHERHHTDKPFFQYLAFAAPHFPLHALPEDIAAYEDTYREGWESIRLQRFRRQQQLQLFGPNNAARLSRTERKLGPPYHFADAFQILGEGEVRTPVPWNTLTATQQQFQAQKMAIHAAMIHRMDIEIGRVFDQIREMGQWENTLVLFLSDNGASAEIMVRDDGHDPELPMGSAGTYLCLGPGWSTTCNTPFRRHKTWTHEGGTSTPLLVSWPAGIIAQGETRHAPGHVIDIVPTLLDVANVKTSDVAPAAPGRSLVPLFTADAGVDHECLWWFHDGHKAIRMENWKAVAPADEPWELYDLSVDRAEAIDLAVPQSEKLKQLVTKWEQQLQEMTDLAVRDLPPEAVKRDNKIATRLSRMKKAQADAKPSRNQVLLNGQSMLLNGRHAFTMTPSETDDAASDKPWVFYGPTLNTCPDKAETWMHQQFLDAGIAIAGIDVGEAYGSPHALPHFDALYEFMVNQGYSRKPVLLGRSRGGLWVSSWAIAHPDRVRGIAGIYPVYDFTTYPGVDRAAAAYGVDAEELEERKGEWNPILRAETLARARIPVCIIHGRDDKVVPLNQNSGALEAIYQDHDAADVFQLIRVPDQGHNFWPGFFQCQELVDFVIRSSR